MSVTNAIFGRIQPRQKVGLVDGGNVLFDCSNCGRPLLDALITQPGIDIAWDVRVQCPYCNDYSFTKRIRGMYSPGGIGQGDEDSVLVPIDSSVDAEGVTTWIVGKPKG